MKGYVQWVIRKDNKQRQLVFIERAQQVNWAYWDKIDGEKPFFQGEHPPVTVIIDPMLAAVQRGEQKRQEELQKVEESTEKVLNNPEKAEDEVKEVEKSQYDAMSMPNLKKLCKEKGIKTKITMKKTDLVLLLVEKESQEKSLENAQ